jgi:hypothetical protein
MNAGTVFHGARQKTAREAIDSAMATTTEKGEA